MKKYLVLLMGLLMATLVVAAPEGYNTGKNHYNEADYVYIGNGQLILEAEPYDYWISAYLRVVEGKYTILEGDIDVYENPDSTLLLFNAETGGKVKLSGKIYAYVGYPHTVHITTIGKFQKFWI